MCGIAGVLTFTADPLVAKAAAERMQNALVHRGPDDSGLWQSPEGDVVFAHRRLSILDLSCAARQPMHSPDGRFTITFNGEIYNFRALRADLEKSGIAFSTTSDTEVILRLFERDGIACVKLLRGMYAFAIWDSKERTCSLARDPLGIKPLYLHQAGRTFAFASELRALIQSRLFTPTLNDLAVQRYFESGSIPEPLTLANETQCLEAGHTFVWSDGKSSRHSFWHLNFAETKTFDGDPTGVTRAALLDSVDRHFVSDVPVGVFLSGGVDSTAILALANATGHRGIDSYSIAVDDPAADEGPVARRTAGHFGARHHEMRLDGEIARSLFDRFLSRLDQPSIDGLNSYTVSALARQHGMKVVLSGLGGDEIFGGYSSFARIPRMLRWHRTLSRIPGARTVAAGLLRSKPWHRRLAEFLRSTGSVEDAFVSLRGIFSKAEAANLTRWFTGTAARPDDTTLQPPSPKSSDPGDAISELEITRYMRNQLLRDSDVMSMAHGLELRVPLVDSALLDTLGAIPASTRLQPGKALLLRAVPEIPEWVVSQKKRGFLFPYEKWLGGDWGRQMDEACDGAPVPVTNWYQRWSIFVLRHCVAGLKQ